MTGLKTVDDVDIPTTYEEASPEGASGNGDRDPAASGPEHQGGEPADSPGSESAAEGAEDLAPTDMGAAPYAGTGEGAEAAATPAVVASPAPGPQERKRRRLLVGLVTVTVLLIAAVVVFVRYLAGPQPLPELLPLPVDINYRPHYLFSIYGVEKPVGVAVSPDGERIYVTETGGGREIKAFDRDGALLHAFSPPSTEPAERAPVYVAVDPTGRVFVTDRLQRAVFVYDREGTLLDAILGPDLTLSEYVSKHFGDPQPGSTLAYNLFGHAVRVQTAGQGEQVLPAPDPVTWAPLGVRLDEQGTLLLTDVVEGRHAVREFPGDQIMASTWREFDPRGIVFGAQGQGSGEFLYPNSAVADSQGRIYVTDGNNGRISVWDASGSFLFEFGWGAGESALSLPRGAVMDKRDRLHVVDAVDQGIKVYDVSEPEPRFLFGFGAWGTKDGEFNYPGDVALDRTGRLYIADRENNRIQVWSY
jgi:DNA-binding beta-propeller fold protein YncE